MEILESMDIHNLENVRKQTKTHTWVNEPKTSSAPRIQTPSRPQRVTTYALTGGEYIMVTQNFKQTNSNK